MSHTVTVYVRNSQPVVHRFETLLEADLFTYKGGNKERLVARCWVALAKANQPTGFDTYEEFRAAHRRWTFKRLHDAFDHLLPL